MDGSGNEVITTLITQAGVSGIFIFFFWRIYTDSNKRISEKDEHIRNLNDKVLEAFKQNTSSQEKLSESIRQNTEAQKTLTERVYDVIKSNGERNHS